MTDKQIMIDGVDVSKCKHYDKGFNYCDQSYLGEGGLLKNTKNPRHCEWLPNCYYKQLKRAEAQCEDMFVKHTDLEIKYKRKEEEYKTLEEIAKKHLAETFEMQREIDQLKSELQKYKDMEAKGLEEFKDVGGCWGCGIQLSLDEVTKEFLQYKKSKQASYEALQARCNELELENRKFRELLITLDEEDFVYEISEIEFQKYLKLKQTLTEIKEYFIKECEICKEQYAVDGDICGECQVYEFLQKISEVLDE